MTLVVGYKSLNTRGMYDWINSFLGHNGNSLNLTYKKLIHVMHIRETVETETLKRSASLSQKDLVGGKPRLKSTLLLEAKSGFFHKSFL